MTAADVEWLHKVRQLNEAARDPEGVRARWGARLFVDERLSRHVTRWQRSCEPRSEYWLQSFYASADGRASWDFMRDFNAFCTTHVLGPEGVSVANAMVQGS